MKTVLASLLLIALLLYLRSMLSSKKKDTEIVKEMESNIVRPKEKVDIINDYFLLKVDTYLHNHYPRLVSWEFSCGSSGYRYKALLSEVKLTFRDGGIDYVTIRTKDVMERNFSETEKKDSSKEEAKETVEEKEKTLSVVDYLFREGDKIIAAVEKAIAERNGFFAYYEVEMKLATEAFMKEVSEKLEENTGYDVSFNNNILEIGFQNMM